MYSKGPRTSIENRLHLEPRLVEDSPASRPQPEARPQPYLAVGRFALRLDELAVSLGISRRTLERERSAGRFPKPDLHIGKAPLWMPETLRRWLAEGGSPR